jgi:Fur family zinc uptake transcriptional regulator|tara:strand:+ start:606 stop:1040 length:435 start_codon:yes stop_codon:yes gene_type:complete
VEKNIQEAEQYCKENGLNFTPVRRKVLEILLHKNTAIGAYEILDLLREAGFKNQPPVAYRALDFLVQNGFAHKIEQLNSFIGCTHPGKDHSPAFMICRNCDSVSEEEALTRNFSVSQIASKAGFTVEKAVIEARGLCHSCTSLA